MEANTTNPTTIITQTQSQLELGKLISYVEFKFNLVHRQPSQQIQLIKDRLDILKNIKQQTTDLQRKDQLSNECDKLSNLLYDNAAQQQKENDELTSKVQSYKNRRIRPPSNDSKHIAREINTSIRDNSPDWRKTMHSILTDRLQKKYSDFQKYNTPRIKRFVENNKGKNETFDQDAETLLMQLQEFEEETDDLHNAVEEFKQMQQRYTQRQTEKQQINPKAKIIRDLRKLPPALEKY